MKQPPTRVSEIQDLSDHNTSATDPQEIIEFIFRLHEMESAEGLNNIPILHWSN